MNEELISFETAKLAKEKGFYIKSPWMYCISRKIIFQTSQIKKKDRISSPTQSLLQKWLRETHNLHIEITIDLHDDLETMCFRGFNIIKMINYKNIHFSNNKVFKTYEKVLEKGLFEALKLI